MHGKHDADNWFVPFGYKTIIGFGYNIGFFLHNIGVWMTLTYSEFFSKQSYLETRQDTRGGTRLRERNRYTWLVDVRSTTCIVPPIVRFTMCIVHTMSTRQLK